MSQKSEATKIIHLLEQGNLYAQCPCPECGEQFLLKDSSLFYLSNFSPQAKTLYQEQLNALKEREEELRASVEKMKTTSKVGAEAVNIGFLLERLAPCMSAFPFDHNDCRSLFDPIDYLVFEGLNEKQKVEKITFMDIKTGKARLNRHQKEIQTAVENNQVSWDTYKMEEKE